MKLTDQEIIEARKRALENNPRSYEPWYEVLTFGREVEKAVLGKYWHYCLSERPVEEGWYVVATITAWPREGEIFVTTLFWSNQRQVFSQQPGGDDWSCVNEIVAFKKMEEFVEEAGLKPRRDEEGSLAHQGV